MLIISVEYKRNIYGTSLYVPYHVTHNVRCEKGHGEANETDYPHRANLFAATAMIW